MRICSFGILILVLAGSTVVAAKDEQSTKFNSKSDLLSLHYDHAPDKDDGHSAAADRTILETLFGKPWMKQHVVAVSGAYGKNAKTFNPQSDAVMDACWSDCGGWLPGHTKRDRTIDKLVKLWSNTLSDGGDVWVKEGGQSDITAEVVRKIKAASPDIDTTKRIHVIQHSKWNEDQTGDKALAHTKKWTHYVKIPDANSFLNIEGGDGNFRAAALKHPVFGSAWKAAFAYYNPQERLDFSDTGELMHILNLGNISIDDFRKRFLESEQKGLSQDQPTSRKN